jgi:hypothetical protein
MFDDHERATKRSAISPRAQTQTPEKQHKTIEIFENAPQVVLGNFHRS